MKILMTSDAVGGVWQYSLDLARGLVRNGVDILLATMGPRPAAAQRSVAANIPGLELVESDYALEWMQNPWRDVDAASGWLQALARSFGADLIHLNGYSHAAADWDCPVVCVAHSCVHSWWRAVHAETPGPEWAEYKRRISSGLAASDVVVAPTAHFAHWIEREYGVSKSKICVIYNFSRVPRAEWAAKGQFSLAAGRIWDEAKNLKVLEQAARSSVWPIQIAGPSVDPQTGIAVDTPLRLLGSLPHAELMLHMRDAALFVHPAVYEPFGLAVLEAARSRCCLLLSDIPSLRELWDDAAVFIDPHDPEAWSHNMDRLSQDHILRTSLAHRALTRSANYSAFQATTEYLHLYERLLRPENHTCGVAA